SSRSVIVEGKAPDGTRKEYRFDPVETAAVALPLVWARRRIEFLLAKGETSEAIALAKESNLVCEGAAFVAWDEVEKVPVSGLDREIYQPSMAPRFLAKTLHAAAGLTAGKTDFCFAMGAMGAMADAPS